MFKRRKLYGINYDKLIIYQSRIVNGDISLKEQLLVINRRFCSEKFTELIISISSFFISKQISIEVKKILLKSDSIKHEIVC